MPLNVLIVPDKFKGTLTADAAARAIARGWKRTRPQDCVEQLPMSDGGDGFGEVMGRLLGANLQNTIALNAAHRRCRTVWWWDKRTKTAIIESAKVIGLAMLPAGKFHPFELDTFGLGTVLREASDRGARTCFIGIGGSATNDGGFGMAKALGWQFLDRKGHPVARWTDLACLDKIEPPAGRKLFARTIVAVDVRNRLLGARGAARVYGPQKGLRPEDMPTAEHALRRLAAEFARQFGQTYAPRPGAGAAGGLGFGLMAFLGATPISGFEVFARRSRLEARMRRSDLVVTAEGSLDRSSLMGKGVGEVAKLARALGKPCFGLGGVTRDPKLLGRWFLGTGALTPNLTTPAEATVDAAKWLSRLASSIAGKVELM